MAVFESFSQMRESLAEWGMSALSNLNPSYRAVELQGKYVLLTGATSGIGKACAFELAKRGAHLTILCRNRNKGEAVTAEIAAATNASVELLVADLSVQADVRRAAAQYLDSGKPLHVLINNAGVLNSERRVTLDGIEETFATNHLAYFLLTRLLLSRLEESAPARIVIVASWGHNQVTDMGFDDINAERMYETFKIYGRSKLGNLLFTRELARRLAGKGVTVNALHPGFVGTNLGIQNGLGWSVAHAVAKRLPGVTQTPEQGANTCMYVATAQELQGVSGKYFVNCRETRPKPWALDDEAAARLWKLSEEMTGLAQPDSVEAAGVR